MSFDEIDLHPRHLAEPQHQAQLAALLLLLGSVAFKVKVPYRRNRYYDNDYYDQQHP